MKILSEKVEGKYELLEFHFSICINNPEIYLILDLIEHTKYNNFLNEDIKYIGINYTKIENNYCMVYILFAN